MSETKTFWVQISAGHGPAECELAVVKTLQEFLREAAAQFCSATVLQREAGAHPGTARSVLIAVTGVQAEDWLRSWEGTVQWISPSPYRPHHGRKNWFIGVSALRPPDAQHPIAEHDLRITTMRASGPGGQHVNKTDSAVRIEHRPTGLVVTAREERSQYANKTLALAKLAAALQAREAAQRSTVETERWAKHHALERGNPVRTYRTRL